MKFNNIKVTEFNFFEFCFFVLKINNMNFLTLNTCKAYGLSDLRIKTTSYR